MARLRDKIAIITGASKGIGAGIARRFGAEGARVVVNYARDGGGAEAVVRTIVDAGGTAIAVQADVSVRTGVRQLFSETEQLLGRPDLVVNNAGIYRMAAIEQVSEADIEDQFATNVFGTFYVMQEAARAFGDAGGAIINLSSIGSRNPQPNLVVYGATKGAVDSLTLGYARELGARGIRINSVAPGIVMTEGLRSHAEQAIIDHFVGLTPLGRIGEAADVAGLAVFLASDDAAFITGERIMVSGGWS